MVCRNDEKCILVRWDDKTIYSFVLEPTEFQKKLLNAVNKLPIICKKVVILYAFEGMHRDEIAEMMKTSLSTVRLLICRSGFLLHGHLTNEFDQNGNSDLRDSELDVLSDWPYLEYASLVELRKNMCFWSRS